MIKRRAIRGERVKNVGLKHFLTLFLALNFSASFSQSEDTKTKIRRDSLTRTKYVTNAKDMFTIYLFATRFSNGILYRGNKTLNYFPISPINFGAGFTHKYLGGSVSIISAAIEKGVFKGNYNFNVHLNAYSRQVGADVLYTLNSGYYVANYRNFIDFEPQSKDRPYFNMRMERITLNLVRIFNGNRYSLNAPLVQGEIQKRNSSSFVINVAASLAFARNGDSLFVPTNFMSSFEGNSILRFGEFYTVSIMPGYGITWILKKKFFIGLVPSFGPSFQYQHLGTSDRIIDQFKVSYKIFGRFGAGYHSRRWTCGISVLVDTENYPIGEGTHVLNNVGKYYFRIGYKFNVPKWAKKYSNYLDKYQEKFEEKVEDNLPFLNNFNW